MAKTYDIEVAARQNTYRETGPISNAEDYQARRSNIRFAPTAKPNMFMIERPDWRLEELVIAVMENYQRRRHHQGS